MKKKSTLLQTTFLLELLQSSPIPLKCKTVRVRLHYALYPLSLLVVMLLSLKD